MFLVLLASLPGLAALTWLFGWGYLLNIAWASCIAILIEALALRMRRRSLHSLRDGSALVTAWLLGLALPPFCPWWLSMLAVLFAIICGRQIFGGLGHNPFNPAMLGYILALVVFPATMSAWPEVRGWQGHQPPDLLTTLRAIWQPASVDALTAATPLDSFRFRSGLTVSEFQSGRAGLVGGRGWEWVNLAFLLGGLLLLYNRIFTWHAPVGMLAGLCLCSLLFYDGGSSASLGSPLFHLLTGATMFGAFFILTDPVTAAVDAKMRLMLGCMVGILVFGIRSWGAYPDGIAFAILLANMMTPLLNRFARPGKPVARASLC